jgi:hypothetical protein
MAYIHSRYHWYSGMKPAWSKRMCVFPKRLRWSGASMKPASNRLSFIDSHQREAGMMPHLRWREKKARRLDARYSGRKSGTRAGTNPDSRQIGVFAPAWGRRDAKIRSRRRFWRQVYAGTEAGFTPACAFRVLSMLWVCNGTNWVC